jgi:hypothetical protein
MQTIRYLRGIGTDEGLQRMLREPDKRIARDPYPLIRCLSAEKNHPRTPESDHRIH